MPRIQPLLAPLTAMLVACGSSPTSVGEPSTPPSSEPSPTDREGPVALSFIGAAGSEVSSVTMIEPVAVVAGGLRPGTRATLEASMAPWTSRATIVVGADGTIDTRRDASVEGTYAGVDVDGLFWSMKTTELGYAKSADVKVRVVVDGAAVAERTLARRFGTSDAQVRRKKGDTYEARLLVPSGQGPFPLMVAFGGSEGGLSGGIAYADDLIPEGYAVLAVAYFGEPGLPIDLESVPLELFDDAIAWAKSEPGVDGSRIGVVGGSRGGELALLLASRIPELRAVIADVPSGYVWGSTGGPGAAWTSKGAPLAAIPSSRSSAQTETTPAGDTAYVLTPVFRKSVSQATPAERDAARIPVEKSGAAILLVGGGDDRLWPSCELAQVAYDALMASGHATQKGDEMHCLEGAGHIVTSLGLPTMFTGYATIGPTTFALGGTPAAAAKAGRARQEVVRRFLARTMRGE